MDSALKGLPGTVRARSSPPYGSRAADDVAYPRAVTVITWVTPDLDETAARFRERLGFHVDDERPSVRLANGVIELVAEEQTAGPRAFPGERISGAFSVAGSNDGAPRPVHPNGAASLLAVGWGTVDHERAAAARTGVRYVFAGLDPLLGSASWLATDNSTAAHATAGRSSTQTPPSELLMEPAREGPLAAALARHGEGPIALYVRVLPRRWDDLHAELSRRGASLRGPVPLPFGDAYLVRPERPWGPFLIFVRVPSTDGATGRPGPAGA
jgi:hypothetical protein